MSTAATTPALFQISDVPNDEYHRISDQSMDDLLVYLEELMEQESTPENGWEVEYNSGVMTVDFGSHGTYVVNKQPPNKQIWLSSPISGPKRYDYSEAHETWFYARDSRSLGDLLREEFKEILGRKDDVQVPLK